jgi:tetratricopeptide (TPR) repeat protein
MSTDTQDLSTPDPVSNPADVIKSIDLSPLKVLIFHHEKENLKGFMSILRWCGLKDMTIVVQLKEAIKHLVSKVFDLIFVTHVGQGKEITKLLEEIKSLDATSDIPLIAITTDGDVKNILRILATGVDEVIVTPLSRKTVENVVSKIFTMRLGSDPVKDKLDSAKELAAAEQFDAAKSIYMELFSQGKSLVEVHLGLSEIGRLMGQWRDTEIHLKKALDLAKSSPDLIETHLQLAQVFFHYGNYYHERDTIEKAIKCYQTSLSLNPFHTESVKALLALLQKRNEQNEIIKVIDEVQASFLPYSRSMEEIALCLKDMAETFADLKMSAEAKGLYERLLQFPHSNVDVHLKVADFFLEEGMVSQVLDRLVNLLERLKDADILFKTGSLLLDIEKRYLAAGSSKAGSNVDLTFFKDLDSTIVISMAEKMFQQGMLLEPQNLMFSLGVARCYIRQRKVEAAADILAGLKQQHAEDAQAMEEVIDALLVEQAYDHAHSWIKEAIHRFPQEINFYVLYSRYYREQNRPYDAIGCLKRSLAIHPTHAESMVSLAELYEGIREYSDAIFYYEKAIELLPDDQTLQERLKRALQSKYKK